MMSSTKIREALARFNRSHTRVSNLLFGGRTSINDMDLSLSEYNAAAKYLGSVMEEARKPAAIPGKPAQAKAPPPKPAVPKPAVAKAATPKKKPAGKKPATAKAK